MCSNGAQVETHAVFNQAPELKDYNCYQQDSSLQRAVRHGGAQWAEAMVDHYGGLVGGVMREDGVYANKYLPEFHSHDRFGHRIDEVVFYPSYHRLMATAIESGWPTLPWSDSRPGAHVARAAMEYMHHQADSGTGCPLTMSFAAVPVIRQHSSIAKIWEPLLTVGHYDNRDAPYFKKRGVTVGMGMTEKQGGTDVRANTTRAEPTGSRGPGESYEIIGHKWFLSAPMSDGFLILAQTKNGLSCFLMPRWCPDGDRNRLYIQRLKNKLGNHSNASSEVEFRGALAWLIGEEGRGIATILEMVALTRFDCVVASAGLMRQAAVQAIHHCRHRQVEGKPLIDQPLMQNVLVDLVVENEAALALAMRLARALDHADSDEQQSLLVRIATAVGKYWVCKRAPAHIYEAMECVGGNGYVEDSILPRLFREAPVNSIWEGSGNVQCLDVLRTMKHNKDCLDILMNEIKAAEGGHALFDCYVRKLERELLLEDHWEYRARHIVEQLALAFQASLLLRAEKGDIAAAFCERRLNEDRSLLYGSSGKPDYDKALLKYSFPPV